MNKFILILGAALLTNFLSCSDDSVEPIMDGAAFESGLINNNSDIVALEITKLTVDLKPKSDGHQSNLNILIHRIEQQTKSLSVVNSCYACIYTLPAKSQIGFELDSMGTPVSRTLFIITSEDNILGQR